ncbi:unnamed protein product, partial [Linum tenue]
FYFFNDSFGRHRHTYANEKFTVLPVPNLFVSQLHWNSSSHSHPENLLVSLLRHPLPPPSAANRISDLQSPPIFASPLLRFSIRPFIWFVSQSHNPLFCFLLSLELKEDLVTEQVRHAQGVHNVEGDKDYNMYMSEELFDARLTPLGWQQVENLRKHVRGIGLDKKIELVVVSPLLRTMQTAVGVFGGEGFTDGVPLMVENAGQSDHSAISSLDCPPFLAVELCREHLLVCCANIHNILWKCFSGLLIFNIMIGLFVKSVFLPISLCREFIHVTGEEALAIINLCFLQLISHWQIQNNNDELWKADIREKDDELAARGLQFFNWLWTRKEKEIAVVSHSGFLYHALSHFGNDCDISIKEEICTHFANCELRSMVIVDRCMIGSVLSTTNYPGKIPGGLDKPSDDANEENHP